MCRYVYVHVRVRDYGTHECMCHQRFCHCCVHVHVRDYGIHECMCHQHYCHCCVHVHVNDHAHFHYLVPMYDKYPKEIKEM